MAFIAEYEAISSFVDDALRAAPEVTLDHENISFTASGALQWAFWAEGADLDAFEAYLPDDDTVDEFEVLAEFHDRRLYLVTVAGDPDGRTHAIATDYGIELVDATASSEEAVVRVRCPSQEAFFELKQAWEDTYGTFVTRRLGAEADGGRAELPLTTKQREILRLALEAGYFDVPRDTTLSELAADLDITASAASQRLRQGVANLVTDTDLSTT